MKRIPHNRLPLSGAAYTLPPPLGIPTLELTLAAPGGGVLTAQVDLMIEKRTWTDMGYVNLGADFEELIEPIHVPADPADGRAATTLRGFTSDPRVAALFQRYLDDRELEPFPVGPVAIPEP